MEIPIDTRSKTPSYIQLADKIRADIQAGIYGTDGKIPSLRTLQQATDPPLAQGTIQKAIRRLEAEGLVVTVSGRGTFVTQLAAQIREGLAEAERGETADLGSFAEYGDPDGDG